MQMNNKNLKSLGDRPEEERRLIASKGGKASVESKKTKNDLKKKILAVSDITVSVPIEKFINIPVANAEEVKNVNVSIMDYIYNQLFDIATNKSLYLQKERVKAIRLIWEINRDREYMKEDLEFKKALAFRELELKQKELELEERRIRIQEESVKNKTIINEVKK